MKDKNKGRTCFLDWQMIRHASPVIDISYFIFCCTDSKVRQQLPHLLNVYHNALTKRMAELKCSIDDFSVSKLNLHMKKYARFGLGKTKICGF